MRARLFPQRCTTFLMGMSILCAGAGIAGSAPASAQSTASAPGIEAIVVDAYDCGSGWLDFHVEVVDLAHDPDGDGTLGHTYSARYAEGLGFSMPVREFNPQAEIAPYTGNVFLRYLVPPTDTTSPSNPPLTSVEITAYVGTVGGGGPVDAERLTFAPECVDDDGEGIDAIIAQLVEVLSQILQSLV